MTPPPAGVRDILIAARAKIEKPENWVREYYAFDRSGHYTNPIGERAACWCILGALGCATGINPEDCDILGPAHDMLTAALKERGRSPSLPLFNDDPATTHADILALYDRAIALAEPTS